MPTRSGLILPSQPRPERIPVKFHKRHILLNILVIDDDESVLDSISLMLMSVGFKITKANNGKDGIRKFNEFSFDAVITDLVMPLGNGNEVARHIRNAGKRIPVIGVTGTPEDIDLTHFDKVLKKPFSFKELIEYLKMLESN